MPPWAIFCSRRAIELAPNIPGGHHVLSLWCLVNRRPDEAIYEAKKALGIDPLSIPYHHNFRGRCIHTSGTAPAMSCYEPTAKTILPSIFFT